MTGQRPNPICLLILLCLTGCATYTHNIAAFRSSLAQGDYTEAMESLAGARKGPNRLLFLLENGLAAHYQGQYQRSNVFFEDAERLADRLFTRSVTREVASLITNDAVRAYRGDEYELVFIHYYRALNYWYLGLPEDALVECRKANLKLAWYASMSEGDVPYRNDAFIHYITGLFYEATGELNDARVSYQDAEAAYDAYARSFGLGAPPALRDDLHRVDEALEGSAVHFASLESAGPHHHSGEGEVVVFSEIGFVPPKIQEEVSLPLFEDEVRSARRDGVDALSRRVALRHRRPYHGSNNVAYWLRVTVPAYRDAAPRTRRVKLTASGRTGFTVPAEDLSAIARVTFEEKQPAVIARTVARGLAKYLATEGIRRKSKVLGFLANLLTASVESADTRSWVSLPHTVQIGRLRLPPGTHDVTAEAVDARGRVVERRTFAGLRVASGGRTFVNFRTYE